MSPKYSKKAEGPLTVNDKTTNTSTKNVEGSQGFRSVVGTKMRFKFFKRKHKATQQKFLNRVGMKARYASKESRRLFNL